MATGKRGEARTVKAVETTLDIVEALCDLNGATVTELADHLGLSTSAVHTHLITLEGRGYVTREDHQYRPSLRFFAIGEQVKRDHLLIYRAGQDELQSLAEATGEVGWMMVEDRNQGVYVHKHRGANAVETGTFPPGQRFPLHCTACGKAILAHLPSDRVQEIIDEVGLPAMTENTVTDEGTLLEELEQIREQGYARCSEESVHGIRTVAAPVLTADGTVLGSISISGPVSRITGDRFRKTLPDQLIESSNLIEIRVMSEAQQGAP